MWQTGDRIAVRGIYNQRAWYVQSAIVVQDHPDEIVLAVVPGAECVAHTGYIHGRHGTSGKWDRWHHYMNDDWDVERYTWRLNRLLILLQPEKYYATIFFWNDASNEFLCHYINFQLPFTRNFFAINTLDLDLDIVINPDFSFEWKDIDDYQKAVDHGAFFPEWIEGIEQAKPEVFAKLEKRQYPFDGSWLDWRPDSAWSPPQLPEHWDKI